jgi:hypothetical protein
VRREGAWGENLNFTGGGALLPVNTALAWPTAGGYNTDTSIILTQKFGDNAIPEVPPRRLPIPDVNLATLHQSPPSRFTSRSAAARSITTNERLARS